MKIILQKLDRQAGFTPLMSKTNKTYKLHLFIGGGCNETGGYRNIMAENTVDILIVDDQLGVRRLLFEALADEGYLVKMAGGGVEALNILSHTLPSLVLLDIKMPGMTGFETLQEIRKRYGQLPVVMMTAYGDMDIIAETKKLGVEHYLIKPFDLNEVRLLVKDLLNGNDNLNYMKDIG
ncbi:response regulator receiver protein [Desulfotomaculum nigrificans CO-1-SRB]|uniref:Stage 0 sporulation protein A homolog n=2 Tax=Desulfotomaculum nigrificans TaxID=1565 RepID=F6B652_DESCC|nr:response regulator receiver protein [Desulfotomaculum nigrificans CO-1-SRB]